VRRDHRSFIRSVAASLYAFEILIWYELVEYNFIV